MKWGVEVGFLTLSFFAGYRFESSQPTPIPGSRVLLFNFVYCTRKLQNQPSLPVRDRDPVPVTTEQFTVAISGAAASTAVPVLFISTRQSYQLGLATLPPGPPSGILALRSFTKQSRTSTEINWYRGTGLHPPPPSIKIRNPYNAKPASMN